MIVVFLGPPGAGKGTQCKRLVEKYHLNHLSSGDILRRERREGTTLGKKAQSYMDSGALVPDDLIVAMMTKEINAASGNVVLDGFPRTLPQAEALDAALKKDGAKIDAVLNLDVDDNKLEERITGRRSCGKCGAAYHTTFMPPKKRDICDACGAALVQRPDDTPEVVRHRIKTYHEQTAPLVSYYSKKGVCHDIDGNADIEKVTQSLFETLNGISAA